MNNIIIGIIVIILLTIAFIAMSNTYISQISTGSSYFSFLQSNMFLFLIGVGVVVAGIYAYIKYIYKSNLKTTRSPINTGVSMSSSDLNKFVGCWKSNETKAILSLEIDPNNQNQIIMKSPIINQIYTLKDSNTIINDLGEKINYNSDSLTFAEFTFNK